MAGPGRQTATAGHGRKPPSSCSAPTATARWPRVAVPVDGIGQPRAALCARGDPATWALRLLCAANPAEWFTVTAAQPAAAATATE